MAAALSTSSRIDAAVAANAMLAHPFYRAWSEGRLTKETLTAYAKQYFHHVDAFPRAVSAVHSNCPDRDGRYLLAENLAEEEGVGADKDDHANLWLMFVEGLGATEREARETPLHAETAALVETFRTLSRRSYASGLGALYAYESQLPAVSATKIEGLDRFYGIADADAIRFFRVHETADVEHSAVCRELLDRLPDGERDEAVAAGETLAKALTGFLDGMCREAGIAC
jgi:pyrroloquinoline-quinone synthase